MHRRAQLDGMHRTGLRGKCIMLEHPMLVSLFEIEVQKINKKYLQGEEVNFLEVEDEDSLLY